MYLIVCSDDAECVADPFGVDRSVFGFRSLTDPMIIMSVAADGSLIVNRSNVEGLQEDYAIYVREDPAGAPASVIPPSSLPGPTDRDTLTKLEPSVQ